MSQSNLGEKYFTARERIGNLHSEVAQLASITSTNLRPDDANLDPSADLNTPFTLLVLGEVNAGKSSFINSLAAAEICPVSNLPKTKEFIRYTYDEKTTKFTHLNNTSQQTLPINWLEKFEVIDTPGSNSPEGDNQNLLNQLAEEASLVLVTFLATNPWTSATWNQITSLPAESHNRIAIILQKSDLLEPVDTAIVLDHLRDLAVKKIGFIPHIFSVSAKLSNEKPVPRLTVDHSGYTELRKFISETICYSTARQLTLKKVTDKIADQLYQIESQIDNQRHNLSQQNDFLASVEDEIDNIRENHVIQLPGHLEQVAYSFEHQAMSVKRTLRNHLNLPRSLFRIFVGDRTSTIIERNFIDRLQSAVEIVAGADAENAIDTCENHWHSLTKRVRQGIGLELRDELDIRTYLSQAKSQFILRLGRAAHIAVGDLHVRRDLEENLKKRNIALKSFTTAILILLSFAAIGGIFRTPWVPEILLILALFFTLTGSFVGIVTRAKITRDFESTLLLACSSFASTLQDDYEEAFRIFFYEYATCLSSIRHHLADERISLEPNLRRWHEVFLTLKSIEQDL